MIRRLLKLFLILVLFLYLLLLVRLIVFKYPDDMMLYYLRNWSPEAVLRHARSANLTPFHTIRYSLAYRQFNLVNVLFYNILAFIPLGLIASALIKRRWRWLLVPLMGLLVSVSLEAMQVVTTLGEGDIDDVILNFTGAVIGYMLFAIIVRIGNWFKRTFLI